MVSQAILLGLCVCVVFFLQRKTARILKAKDEISKDLEALTGEVS